MALGSEPDWIVAQRLERQATQASLAGYFSAKIWIIAPVLISLPIMWIFGEGGYIIPIDGALWAGIFIYGSRLRRSAPPKTELRARGFWMAFWSFILSALCLGFSATILITLIFS